MDNNRDRYYFSAGVEPGENGTAHLMALAMAAGYRKPHHRHLAYMESQTIALPAYGFGYMESQTIALPAYRAINKEKNGVRIILLR